MYSNVCRWKIDVEKACGEDSWGEREKKTVLKRLAGSKWGSSRSVLNAVYEAYMKLVLQYGCEALITVAPTILNKLEVRQNQAVRLKTGAVRSTSSPCKCSLYT
jgi:hypothetical protein